MYPRNAASPPRIAIGAVVQISDGAVQTSGCTVRVMEQGGAEGDGGGTTAYSTDGIVLYTPTQAETDQIAFILIAKKTGCIPVSQTIVTSASDVTGYAGVDWSKVNAPTTAQGLTGTTIATTQKVDVETIKTNPVVNAGTVTFPTGATLASTTNITAGTIATVTTLTNLPAITPNWLTAAGIAASALDGKGNWNIGKTGYALTATTGLGNQTADITGTISTVTTLTNLPAITANWLTAAGIAADAGAEIADAVWDEAIAGHLTGGTTGASLNGAGSAGDPWTTALPGAYGAGTAGYIIGTNINGTITSRASSADMATALGYMDTEIAAILADTNELQTDWANGGRLDVILDARSSQTSVDDLPTNAELSTALGTADDAVLAAIAALSIPTAAQNADALLGRNVAGGSSTGRTVSEAFFFLRNRWIISGGTLTVYATDDTTSSWTATITQTAGNPVSESNPA
jgi:hypothetical protein